MTSERTPKMPSFQYQMPDNFIAFNAFEKRVVADYLQIFTKMHDGHLSQKQAESYLERILPALKACAIGKNFDVGFMYSEDARTYWLMLLGTYLDFAKNTENPGDYLHQENLAFLQVKQIPNLSFARMIEHEIITLAANWWISANRITQKMEYQKVRISLIDVQTTELPVSSADRKAIKQNRRHAEMVPLPSIAERTKNMAPKEFGLFLEQLEPKIRPVVIIETVKEYHTSLKAGKIPEAQKAGYIKTMQVHCQWALDNTDTLLKDLQSEKREAIKKNARWILEKYPLAEKTVSDSKNAAPTQPPASSSDKKDAAPPQSTNVPTPLNAAAPATPIKAKPTGLQNSQLAGFFSRKPQGKPSPAATSSGGNAVSAGAQPSSVEPQPGKGKPSDNKANFFPAEAPSSPNATPGAAAPTSKAATPSATNATPAATTETKKPKKKKKKKTIAKAQGA